MKTTYDSFLSSYSNFIKKPISKNNCYGFEMRNGMRIYFEGDRYVSNANVKKFQEILKESRGE
jgi:hypothetical protein